MATDTSMQPEVLIARKIPWRKRLWFRVLSLLLLLVLILAVLWWWPRRGMVAVWRVDGSVQTDAAHRPATNAIIWIDRATGGRFSQHYSRAYTMISSAHTDSMITGVNLIGTTVDDQWLFHLQRFPKLRGLGIDNRHLGPGLSQLRELQQLRDLNVHEASQSGLDQLHLLPELEIVKLWNPTKDATLEGLSSLTKLRELVILDAASADELLATLPDLPQLQVLRLNRCHEISERGWACLRRTPNLSSIDLVRSGPLEGHAWKELSHLKRLKTIGLLGRASQFNDAALKALQQMESLEEIVLHSSKLGTAEIDSLSQALPGIRIDAP